MTTAITLSVPAIGHIEKMLARQTDKHYFRLGVTTSGCSGFMYKPELIVEPDAEDERVESNGFVFFVAKNVVEMIAGTEVDLQEKGLGQAVLSYHNPRAESICGCGESFTLKDQE